MTPWLYKAGVEIVPVNADQADLGRRGRDPGNGHPPQRRLDHAAGTRPILAHMTAPVLFSH